MVDKRGGVAFIDQDEVVKKTSRLVNDKDLFIFYFLFFFFLSKL